MSFSHAAPQQLILIGAGGHARVLHALAEAAGHSIIGICDPTLFRDYSATWQGIPVLGDDFALEGYDPHEFGLINGIGQLVGSSTRRSVYERIKRMGFRFPPLIHPAAWVATGAELADGVQVMAGAIIQPGCNIGENTVVNTKVSVDHDCKIGPHVHVAPGVTLCGGVSIGEGSFIGAGAVVVQGVQVGLRSVIGAGTSLRRNLNDDVVFVG